MNPFSLLTLAVLLAVAGRADVPVPREADFVIEDFKFTTGETLPRLNLHYTTLGTPSGNNAVLIMHGTGGTGHQFLAPQLAEELPDFIDALMPLASVPIEISGRNRFYRRMILDPLRNDPENGLCTAIYTLTVMATTPLQLQKQAANREQADQLFDDPVTKRMAANRRRLGAGRTAGWRARVCGVAAPLKAPIHTLESTRINGHAASIRDLPATLFFRAARRSQPAC